MEDEEIEMANACADLVSMKKTEIFPLKLLGSVRPGTWVSISEFCRQIGLPEAAIKPDAYATWLFDPAGIEGYAVIMFYHAGSGWSMCAHYNRQRLLGKPISPANNVKEISELIAGSEALK